MLQDTIHQMSTIRDYFGIIFKHKTVIIMTIIIIVSTVYASLNLITPIYEASSKILIEARKPTEAEYYSEAHVRGVTLFEVEIIKSTPISERVVDALQLYNLPLDYGKNYSSRLKALLIDYRTKKIKADLEKLKPEERRRFLHSRAVRKLKSSIMATQLKDSNMINLNVRDYNPNAAVTLTNAVSRSYIIFDLERQLAEIQLRYGKEYSLTKQIEENIDKFKDYLDGRILPDIEGIGPASVKIIDQAKEAALIKMYNKPAILSLSLLLSIFVGISFAFLLEYLDQTIKSPNDIEKLLNIPFLGSLPKRESKEEMLIRNPGPTSNYTHFFHSLSEHLDLLMKDNDLRSILITDAEFSADTLFVIANIGICLARKQADHKVLIIDANFRNYSISEIFNITTTPGLADVLEGKIPFEDAVQNVESGLSILPAGQTTFSPTALLNSSKMSDIIKTTKVRYERVFLVCGDLKNFADGVILSSIVDGVILVVNEGKVRRQVLEFAIAPLRRKKTNLLGVILNNRNMIIPKVIYDRL